MFSSQPCSSITGGVCSVIPHCCMFLSSGLTLVPIVSHCCRTTLESQASIRRCQRKPHPTRVPSHLSCACGGDRAGSERATHTQLANRENAALSVRAGQSLYKSNFHAKIVAISKYALTVMQCHGMKNCYEECYKSLLFSVLWRESIR